MNNEIKEELKGLIDQKQALLKLLEEKENQLKYNQFVNWYADSGKYRRELYPKHVQFLNASAKHGQLALIGANRSGKSFTTKYAVAMHATGKYPHWYKGRRFLNPINVWVVGKSSQSVRDILQHGLLGDLVDPGTGMIPKEDIGKIYRRAGTSDAVETVLIKHVSGGWSKITFKSYEQGWEAFHGTYMHLIVLDEEPRDQKIYTECITRTANDVNPGIVMCSFTPLFGLSEIVLSFMPFGKLPEGGTTPEHPDMFAVQVSWADQLPHLPKSEQDRLIGQYSDFERAARTAGDPGMSAGRIYTTSESEIKVEPFPIPSHWLKVYGMDFGKNVTAVVWGALDPDTDILYLYSEYYGQNKPLAVNASSIRQRSEGIIGVIDPAAVGGNPIDCNSYIDLYRLEGLDLELAGRNLVETGISSNIHRIETGRLKVFSTLVHFFNEYNTYSKDEDGRIIKKNDHLMDAWRYLQTSGLNLATPSKTFLSERQNRNNYSYDSSGRDQITGY